MGKTLKSSITKDDFNKRLSHIKMNHKIFSEKTGISYKTVNNWKEIPCYTEVLLEKFELEFLLRKALIGEICYKDIII